MKRILSILALLLLGAASLSAQQTIVPAGRAFISTPRLNAGEALCQDGAGNIINDHTFVFHANGGPSAVLVTVTGTTGAGQSSITTSTNTAGASIHFTGVYNRVCLVATTITGLNAFIDASYEGVNAASAASGAVTVTSGTIAFDQSTPGTTNGIVCNSGCSGGSLTNNNAAPSNNNGGVLSGIANAAAPSWTEGRQVLASMNLSGQQRIVGESGSIKSGAVASGAIASGAIVDGADVAEGTKADAKCTTSDTTPCSVIALLKELAGLAATDPCAGVVKTNKAISINTATTTVLVAASASNKLYICSMFLQAAGADNVAIVEDATAACASPDAGILGGTTAATGQNLAANQGYTYGSGAGMVAVTASTNVNVCAITSQAVQLSGNLSYVLAP